MIADTWDIGQLRAVKERDEDQLRVLWSTDLPATREADPALWESLMGFFETAVVEFCKRPGHLVVTPRLILKALKRQERVPFCGQKVIDELFRKGDLVRAGTLEDADKNTTSTTTGTVFSSLRSSLGRYLWSSTPTTQVLDAESEVVPAAALARVADAATRLVGPIATAEVHTLQSLANACTGGNERDAAAVAAHLVSQGKATVLRTLPSRDNEVPVVGIRLGSGNATDSDRKLLQTKAARENMVEMVSHLESELATKKQEALEAAKAGDRALAIAHVQRKSALEKKLAGARATLRKLTDVLMAVDEAESNRQAVSALETGMESLRATTEDGGVTADRVDDIAVQLDELLGKQEDLRYALQGVNANTDADLMLAEQELNDLLAEDSEKKLKDPSATVPDVVPVNPVDANSAAVAAAKERTPEEEAEEELRKLMEEAGVSPPHEVESAAASPARPAAAPAQ